MEATAAEEIDLVDLTESKVYELETDGDAAAVRQLRKWSWAFRIC
jgi:hypothetical protein